MFRLSIRALMFLIACFGAGLVALKNAGEVSWMILKNGVVLGLMIATVMALVDRGKRQAIASGFASCLAIYLIVYFLSPGFTNQTWVPTWLLDRSYDLIATQIWIDRRTQVEVAADPTWPAGLPPPGIGGKQLPASNYFMAVGHSLWALSSGYLGGRFAAWIYTRRSTSEAAARHDPPSGL